jgi:hypothetical protein
MALVLGWSGSTRAAEIRKGTILGWFWSWLGGGGTGNGGAHA